MDQENYTLDFTITQNHPSNQMVNIHLSDLSKEASLKITQVIIEELSTCKADFTAR